MSGDSITLETDDETDLWRGLVTAFARWDAHPAQRADDQLVAYRERLPSEATAKRNTGGAYGTHLVMPPGWEFDFAPSGHARATGPSGEGCLAEAGEKCCELAWRMWSMGQLDKGASQTPEHCRPVPRRLSAEDLEAADRESAARHETSSQAPARPGWSLHKLYSVARTRVDTQPERYGQALFNTLVEVRPDIAERLRGSDADPFYANGGDEKAERAIEVIESMWGGPCTHDAEMESLRADLVRTQEDVIAAQDRAMDRLRAELAAVRRELAALRCALGVDDEEDALLEVQRLLDNKALAEKASNSSRAELAALRERVEKALDDARHVDGETDQAIRAALQGEERKRHEPTGQAPDRPRCAVEVLSSAYSVEVGVDGMLAILDDERERERGAELYRVVDGLPGVSRCEYDGHFGPYVMFRAKDPASAAVAVTVIEGRLAELGCGPKHQIEAPVTEKVGRCPSCETVLVHGGRCEDHGDPNVQGESTSQAPDRPGWWWLGDSPTEVWYRRGDGGDCESDWDLLAEDEDGRVRCSVEIEGWGGPCTRGDAQEGE